MSYISEVERTVDGGSIQDEQHVSDVVLLDIPTSISAYEEDLTRQATAHQTCSQQFNLYVDIWDMPMTECLTHIHIPPYYLLGVGALTQLSNSAHFSVYFGEAQSWIKS